ncbi:TPA: hypothetical protein I7295_24385 [Vibrio parahaemolyticus]|nr:hypothetical protein [Vibrio parahaemolyticus]EHJ9962175.1 hypothetical protein [Vibrio parahaemolyticus]EHK0040530.1 hypothetical protein [Vibrio parahaemolyticus]EIU7737173.1 hypothetical protein [Vibrio parahaemolyticus]HAS6465254.1 hypothetical protein [Vibrio parahaemolyticus]
MFEAIPVNFGMIRYFLDMLIHKPEHNTLVVGKRLDGNELFIVPLVDDARVAGFYVYPNCRFFFWRKWSLRKEFFYVFKLETSTTMDPNGMLCDGGSALTENELRIYKKYGYKVIVKTRLRNYVVPATFKLNDA